MQLSPWIRMERGALSGKKKKKAGGPSDSRLHTPSSHTDTIDLTGHGDRGYLNRLDKAFRRSQAGIWLDLCAAKCREEAI